MLRRKEVLRHIRTECLTCRTSIHFNDRALPSFQETALDASGFGRFLTLAVLFACAAEQAFQLCNDLQLIASFHKQTTEQNERIDGYTARQIVRTKTK